MSEWQPIETCPQMRNVLLFAVTDVDEGGTVRNWKMESGYKRGDDYPLNKNETPWRWGEFRVMIWDAQPTHWMPLPEPPR